MHSTKKMFLAFAASLLALNPNVLALAGDGDGRTLELLGESHGPVPALPCTMPGCATVIAIRHHLGVETVKSEDGSGVYFEQQVGDDLYPAPPLALPMFDGRTL